MLVKLDNPQLLSRVVEIISELVTDVRIKISEYGLSISAMDPADQEQSIKEQRINSIKSLYYSKPEVQRAIFDFSSNREVVPRYFEGFGKRPDSLQYPGDIFPMVQRGATSFHCSIELWQDSLSLSTGQTREQLNNLRIGWGFFIDIYS